MKAPSLLTVILLAAITTLAQQAPPPGTLPPQPGHTAQTASAPPKDTANYLITVNWTNAKQQTNSLRVLTAEGSFSLDTIQSSVRIDDNDIPTTVSFNGTVTPLDAEKAVLKVFLGRTVPYVTGTYSGTSGKSSSSYQQLRVGLSSTFTVNFGKPVVIQADENGEVAILVKRQEM